MKEILIDAYMFFLLLNYLSLSLLIYLWYFRITRVENYKEDGDAIWFLIILGLTPILNILTGILHTYGMLDMIRSIYNSNFNRNDKDNRDSR